MRNLVCVVVLPDLPSTRVANDEMMRGSFIYVRSQNLEMTNLLLHVFGHHCISEQHVSTKVMCSCQETLRSSQVIV